MFWLVLLFILVGGVFFLLFLSMVIPSHTCDVNTVPNIIHCFTDDELVNRWGKKWTLKKWSSLQQVELHQHYKLQNFDDGTKKELSKLFILLKYGGLFIDHNLPISSLRVLLKYLKSEYFIAFHISQEIVTSLLISSPGSIIIQDVLKSLNRSETDTEQIKKQISISALKYKAKVLDLKILK